MGNPREDNILSDAEHLYAEDLGGKEVTLTVDRVEKEEVKGGGSGRSGKKYTFHFRETPKGWIPGIGVRRQICGALGTTDRKAMPGARLTLYPTTCDAFGQRDVPCIRLRRAEKPARSVGQPPAGKPSELNEPPADWTPELPTEGSAQ